MTSGAPPRHPAIRPGPDDVLDAAETLLADGGFDRLSVRRIAETLGVSRQVLYTHFNGMPGLLDALHERLSARLAAAVDSVGGPPGSDRHILEAVGAYRHVARTWPALSQLVFERPVPDYVVGTDARRAGLESFGRIVDAAEAWLAARTSKPLPRRHAVDLARAVWSSIHGFVVLERVGFADTDETDELSDRAIRSLLAGWIEVSTADT